MWTLNRALIEIRKIQKDCMEAGFYIALAGGVLNKGQCNDSLINDRLHLSWPNLKIEIIIIEHQLCSRY